MRALLFKKFKWHSNALQLFLLHITIAYLIKFINNCLSRNNEIKIYLQMYTKLTNWNEIKKIISIRFKITLKKLSHSWIMINSTFTKNISFPTKQFFSLFKHYFRMNELLLNSYLHLMQIQCLYSLIIKQEIYVCH